MDLFDCVTCEQSHPALFGSGCRSVSMREEMVLGGATDCWRPAGALMVWSEKRETGDEGG